MIYRTICGRHSAGGVLRFMEHHRGKLSFGFEFTFRVGTTDSADRNYTNSMGDC